MTLTRGKLVATVLGLIAAAYVVTAAGKEQSQDVAHETEARVLHDTVMLWRPVETEHGSPNRTTSYPASLSGTDPDGDLTVTVSRRTIQLFDYYLTTLGETDLTGVRALVAAEVNRQSPDKATQVLALFDRYISYLEDVHDVHASTIDGYFAQTLALQQRHFGRDAELIFGEDNALAARLLASAAATPSAVP